MLAAASPRPGSPALRMADPWQIALVTLGALVAGFVNGFAGFGTALVASGFWFLVLPAPLVPPLLVISAVAGQIVGMIRLKAQLDWRKGRWLVSGGVLGVPLGTAALVAARPEALKLVIGLVLLAYVAAQGSRLARWRLTPRPDGWADRLVGFVGGVLGGFGGVSGPPPLVWLQLRGLSGAEARARYQPFNFAILSLSLAAMALAGRVTAEVLLWAALTVPLSILGALIGLRVWHGTSDTLFRRAVLTLLALSGVVLVAQAL